MSRLYLVDVSSYIFRAFHAIPMLTTKNGLPTNAVLGVVNMLLKLVTEEKPERMAIVFDAGGPTFRDELADDYKANRNPMPDALVPQLPYIRSVIEATDKVVIDKKFATPGERIVIVAGWSPAMPGTMNGLVIHTVGTRWTAVPTAQVMRQLLKAEKE